ncbi:helix-turn-helix domain-containing protein [Hyphomicrobium zavarzinii]|uniref:helix-turn-helix domain-containing protein n=1 Tax=Hyphomicrobium zavarzinii TaxID=48292 RepID=UPI00037C94B6|nr:AraC family transcriptional regulator [Hyphomicrobium zavarzinii]
MYERAATASGAFLPIWHLDRGRGLFVGPLTYNAPHAHSVPVYLAGLYEAFGLRVAGGAWIRCRTAVVPAGVSYELDVGGSPIAVLYLEPNEAGAHALAPLVRGACDERGALIGDDGEIALLRDLYETSSGAGAVGDALDSLIAFSKPRAKRPLDGRVARAVVLLSERAQDAMPAADVARSVGLSSSRFQHLFAEEVGVPFRRFRVWQRLRAAIGEIVAGSTFTEAAHAAGFADQAHFARQFRLTFGAPASPSLRKVRRAS